MGFQFVVMFIDSFLDDVTYVSDVEDCVWSMICYIAGCICYGSENFGLASLHEHHDLEANIPSSYSGGRRFKSRQREDHPDSCIHP